MGMPDPLIETLLRSVTELGASDLHLLAESPPFIRLDGTLKSVDFPELAGEELEKICYTLVTEEQKQEFERRHELDFALDLPELGRFRVNFYRSMGNIAAAFRSIPLSIPLLDDLAAPEICKEMIGHRKGLILVTGPTGSGKSTTLAAMLNEINLREQKHIITIEDPIEFVHKSGKCLFSHREVGEDAQDFATALKYALRQDPDILLIGEMRDRETIEAALTAAETGHLVLGTLHTSSAAETIHRIIDTFSGDKQAQIRAMLAGSLLGVIAQTLLPKVREGRIAAWETLINTHAISNLIREGRIHQIYSQMQLGQENTGMQTQTQSILALLREGRISKETAIQYADRKDELDRALKL
jgi:twitching motility protein PilT